MALNPLILTALGLMLVVPPVPAKTSGDEGLDEHAMFVVVGGMYDIDPGLLETIAAVESSGRAGATSEKGAQGLMQLMPTTAQRFGVDDSYDPVQSALGAARFIAWLRRHLNNGSEPLPLPDLLAAYNAGAGAVERFRGIPPFAETRDYIRKVLWLYLAGTSPPVGSTRHTAAANPRRDPARVDPDGDALGRLSAIHRARIRAESEAPSHADYEAP